MIHLRFNYNKDDDTNFSFESYDTSLQLFIEKYGRNVAIRTLDQMGRAIALLGPVANLNCEDIEFLLVKGKNSGIVVGNDLANIGIVDFGQVKAIYEENKSFNDLLFGYTTLLSSANDFFDQIVGNYHIPPFENTEFPLIFLRGFIRQIASMKLNKAQYYIARVFYIRFMERYKINTLASMAYYYFDAKHETLPNMTYNNKYNFYNYIWEFTPNDLEFVKNKLKNISGFNDVVFVHLFKKKLDFNKPTNIGRLAKTENIGAFVAYSKAIRSFSLELLKRKDVQFCSFRSTRPNLKNVSFLQYIQKNFGIY